MASTLASAVSLLHPCSPKFSRKTCWKFLLGLFVIRPWFRRLWTRLNYITPSSGNDELFDPFSLTLMSRKCSVFNFCDDEHGSFLCLPKNCVVYVFLTAVFNQGLKSRCFRWFACFSWSLGLCRGFLTSHRVYVQGFRDWAYGLSSLSEKSLTGLRIFAHAGVFQSRPSYCHASWNKPVFHCESWLQDFDEGHRKES